MKVRIRNIEACCACGSCDFRAPHASPYDASEVLFCAGCGRSIRYGELLNQIGDEATRQSNRALESLRRACSRARELK